MEKFQLDEGKKLNANDAKNAKGANIKTFAKIRPICAFRIKPFELRHANGKQKHTRKSSLFSSGEGGIRRFSPQWGARMD